MTGKKASIVKASRFTHATRGYLVFQGSYPHMTMKYCKTWKGAQRIKTRLDKRK